MSAKFKSIVVTTLIIAFVVIVLGAYVRLTDAGLGCPDWPGCYGHLIGIPGNEAEVNNANEDFERTVEAGKAWREMVHRYFAGALGLLIFIIAIFLFRRDDQGERHIIAGTLLVAALIFQAALGMWTVTLQLKPLIVMGHLIGGFTLFNLLAWQWLRVSRLQPNMSVSVARPLLALSVITLVILICQIALGGWVSSNYAALACVDFPQCQQSWWPPMDFKNGFILWRGLGVDYEFGVLDHPARVAIHYAHRIGALITTIAIIFYVTKIYKYSDAANLLRNNAFIILILLAIQLGLGISNIIFKLPLAVAVMHNGVALLLLFSLVSSAYMLKYARST